MLTLQKSGAAESELSTIQRVVYSQRAEIASEYSDLLAGDAHAMAWSKVWDNTPSERLHAVLWVLESVCGRCYVVLLMVLALCSRWAESCCCCRSCCVCMMMRLMMLLLLLLLML